MEDGSRAWVPISNHFTQYLPKKRAFTKLEAVYSLQLDHFQKNRVTVLGLANRWQWSRKRVANFLKEIGVVIKYPLPTSKRPNQKGQIALHKGYHITFIDFNNLDEQRNIKGSIKGSTTIKETINNNKDTPFTEDSAEFRLAKFFLSEIRKHAPDYKEPDLQEWAKHIDYMLRLDKREPDEIAHVIRWCQEDDFWKGNILSTKKLRAQYDQLSIKMGKGAPRGNIA